MVTRNETFEATTAVLGGRYFAMPSSVDATAKQHGSINPADLGLRVEQSWRL